MKVVLAVVAALGLSGAVWGQSVPSAADYAAMPNIAQPQLSPNGERIAFMSGETRQDRTIMVISLTGDPAKVIDAGDDQILNSISWVSDEHLLLTYLDRGRDNFSGEIRLFARDYILNVDDQNSVELPNNAIPAGLDRADPESMLVWIPISRGNSGSRLQNNQYNIGMRLYHQSLDRDRRRMAEDGSEDFAYILNADGTPIVRVSGNDAQETVQDFRIVDAAASAEELEVWYRPDGEGWQLVHQERFELDAEFHFAARNWKDWTGVVEAIAGVDAEQRYGYFSSITEGREGTRRDGRRRAIYRIELATGAIEGPIVESDRFDIGGSPFNYITDWRTNALIGFRWAEDRNRVHYIDPQFAALQEQIEGFFPDANVTLASWDEAFARVIITVEGGTTSGTHYMLDTASGNVSLLGPSRPRVPDAVVAPVQIVNYTARDGVELFGYLTTPPGRDAADLPLVVMPHGGPEARDIYGFDVWAQFIATRGYAVFQPQFRGSSGMGQDFAEAGYRRWGQEMQDDVSDSIAMLAERGVADPDRVCIFGWSYGGYAALAGATFTPELYRCAVAGAGVSDLRRMMIHERDSGGGRTQLYWARNIGDYRGGDNRDDLAAISPASNADQVSIPLLLVHGTADLIVPHEQSEYMAAAMDEAERPYEMVSINGGPHTSSQMRVSDQLALLEALERFLAEHNPPD